MRACNTELHGDLVVARVGEVGERERHPIALGQCGDRGLHGPCALGRQQFAETVGVVGFGGRGFLGFGAERGGLEAAPAQQIERMIAGDFHDPRSKRLREVVAREAAIRPYERFLRRVVRALGRAEQLPA